MKKYTDLTPDAFLCPMSDCPAVLKQDVDTYVIIGKTLGAKDADLAHRVGDDETAVAIPAALLEAAIEGVLKKKGVVDA